ncbi:MAG: TSUP family transporter, partial [Burkholderiaceae bacterium]
MELTFVALVAFAAALLTFVSGFGLGTLLMPAMALFMPIEAAVALTALVHLLVNVLKISLVGREASRQVLLNFGIPSLCGAVIGGWTLTQLGDELEQT